MNLDTLRIHKRWRNYYMKTLLNILIFFFLTTNFANGQTMDSLLQKLIDNKLIEKNNQKILKSF
jgi:hypothetical protein